MKKIRTMMAALVAVAAAATLAPKEAEARQVVKADVPRGVIVVRNSQRKLYLGIGGGKAIRYNVAVGRYDRQWTGTARIRSKRRKPAWRPPAVILREKPHMRRYFPGGSPSNPMGAAALLIGNQRAIHGTNRPGLIGRPVSYGCIRMHNRDILDLYKRVRWGTKVVVKR